MIERWNWDSHFHLYNIFVEKELKSSNYLELSKRDIVDSFINLSNMLLIKESRQKTPGSNRFIAGLPTKDSCRIIHNIAYIVIGPSQNLAVFS